jgi:hypothetical protein
MGREKRENGGHRGKRVKVKLPLYLINKHPSLKVYGGIEV